MASLNQITKIVLAMPATLEGLARLIEATESLLDKWAGARGESPLPRTEPNAQKTAAVRRM